MLVTEGKRLRPQRRLGRVVAQIDRRERHGLEDEPQDGKNPQRPRDNGVFARAAGTTLRRVDETSAGAGTQRTRMPGGIGANGGHRPWMPSKARRDKRATLRRICTKELDDKVARLHLDKIGASRPSSPASGRPVSACRSMAP